LQDRSTAPSPVPALSAWWTDVGVAAFALFTLASNLTVATGGSPRRLALASAVLLALLLGVAWRMRPSGDTRAAEAPAPEPWRERLAVPEPSTIGVLALAAAGASWWTGSLWPAWLTLVGAAGWRLLRSTRATPPTDEGDAPPRASEVRWLVPALAVLCALTVAVSHRANEDDAFYLNIAVAAADAPSAPLLAGDTLHGYDDVPIDLPVFRLLAYEPAIALLSLATGVDALVLAHVVLPPLFALLIPLVWARLLRRLAPAEWPWLLVGLVVSLYLFADGRSTHGEFALLRLQQGKSILLVVLWPLLADAGLAFGRTPSAGRWARLAAAQIAAVGLTSNALWLAPAIGGLGVCAGVLDRVLSARSKPAGDARPTATRMLATLAIGGLASMHAVGSALVLRAEMLRAFHEAPHPLPSLEFSATTFMTEALEIVAGQGLGAAWMLFAVIAATAAAPTAAMRRFIAIFAGATALLFWSPLFAHVVATQITGPDTYFRVLWLWPVPLAFAVVLTSGVGFVARLGHRGRGAQALAFATLVALGLVVSGGTLTPSPANGVRLGWPTVKIDPTELDVARALTHHAGPEEFVLAPVGASHWIGLLHDHPHPLVVREMLLDSLADRFDQRELTLRAQLTRMVGGDVRLPRSGRLLAHAIESVPLQAVALQGDARSYDDVIAALRASPLERVESNDAFEVWARTTPDSTGANAR